MKNRARVLGLVCGALVAASVASMTGCSTAAESSGTSAETIRSTNVALSVQDSSGAEIGSGSGILIAPKLVLTAAHLVAGQTSWTIRTADGSVAHGSRGVTYDWLVYGNDAAHPALNDLAVVYLDEPINLPAYPHAAPAALGAGADATRVHGEGAVFTNVTSKLGEVAGFPHSYVTEIPSGEALVTGGAVLDAKNEIVGIVTGKGLTTGKLYIARTDGLSSWVGDESNTCDATSTTSTTPSTPVSTSSSTSSSSSTSGDIVVKTYTPPIETTSSSSSSSGYPSTSSSSSSGSSSSSSGTPSTSSSSSTGGPSTCTPTQPNGNCYGSTCGTTSSSSSSSSGGPTTTSSSSSSGSSTSSTSSSSGGDDDDDTNGSANPITPTVPVTSSSSTSSSGSSSSSSSGSSSSSSTGGTSSDDGDDTTIDYGACPGCGTPTTGIHVK